MEEKVIELAQTGAKAAVDSEDQEAANERQAGSTAASTSLAQRATELFQLRNKMLRSLHCVSVAKKKSE